MISKRKIAHIVIIAVILTAFDTFTLTSGARIALGFSVLAGLTGFLTLIRYYSSFPKQLRQLGMIILGLFAFSIVTANITYSQPLRAGVIANIYYLVSGVAFLIYYLSFRYKISFDETSDWIVKVAWVLFIVYMFILVGDVNFKAQNEETTFGLQSLRKGFINLASIIYISWYFRRGNLKYLLLGFVLFSVNHWADFQRFLFLAFILALALAVIYNKKKVSGLKVTIGLVIIIPLAMIIVPQTNMGQQVIKKFDSAYELFNPESSNYSESSVNIRVEETTFAMKSIRKYPYTGVGRLASSYKKQAIGDIHFFASDIGVIGVLYTFGIFGILLLLIQLWIVIRKSVSRNLFKNESTSGLKIFLFYIFLNSIMTGNTIYQPSEYLIVLALILLNDQLYLQNEADSAHE